MARHTYLCENGHSHERDYHHTELPEKELCPECNSECYQDFRGIGMSPDVWDNSFHPSIGQYNSRQEFNEKLQAKGLMLDEPGCEDQIKRNAESRYQKEMQPIRDAKDKMLQSMTLDECKTLINNSINGPDYVMHPTHSPAGVPIEAKHIEQLTGGKVIE